jgi:hypothetical protein
MNLSLISYILSFRFNLFAIALEIIEIFKLCLYTYWLRDISLLRGVMSRLKGAVSLYDRVKQVEGCGPLGLWDLMGSSFEDHEVNA